MTTEIRLISTIAREIRADWKKVNYAAEPYLREMARVERLDSRDPDLGFPGAGTNFVLGFLGNASSWRGDTAKRVKAELREMLKGAH